MEIKMLSIKKINLLEAQNEGLKKQNADLQKENAILKEENYNKLIAWEELKADNERLKEEIKRLDEDDFCYEISEIEYQRIQKYKQTLQEIKKILLQAMDVKSNAYNHFLKVEQAIDLITKAESEGE